MRYSEYQKYFCPKCFSENIEAHSSNDDYAYIRFLCCNCFLRFSNYDFLLNSKIAYRMASIEIGENTYKTIMANIIKNLTLNGVMNHISMEDLFQVIRMGSCQEDHIVHLSRLETNLKHYNNMVEYFNNTEKNENSVLL